MSPRAGVSFVQGKEMANSPLCSPVKLYPLRYGDYAVLRLIQCGQLRLESLIGEGHDVSMPCHFFYCNKHELDQSKTGVQERWEPGLPD